MSYRLPSAKAVLYRLWRLRRLIAVSSMIPILVMAVYSGWKIATGSAPVVAFAPFAILTVAMMAAHAVLFPQGRSETLALSLTLSVLVLASPLAGTSVLGWALLLLVALALIMLLQTRILFWEMSSPSRRVAFKASVHTQTDLSTARRTFSLQPDSQNARFTCGSVDKDGVFEVHMVPSAMPDFLEDALPSLDVDPADEAADEEAFEEFVTGMLSELPEDERAEIERACQNRNDPSFWAVNLRDTPQEVETLILVRNDDGRLVEASRTIYRFVPKRTGFRVTEYEVNPDYPIGSSLGIWLTDFQADGMILSRDEAEGRDTLALRAASDDTILTLVGKAIMRRQMADV